MPWLCNGRLPPPSPNGAFVAKLQQSVFTLRSEPWPLSTTNFAFEAESFPARIRAPRSFGLCRKPAWDVSSMACADDKPTVPAFKAICSAAGAETPPARHFPRLVDNGGTTRSFGRRPRDARPDRNDSHMLCASQSGTASGSKSATSSDNAAFDVTQVTRHGRPYPRP